MGLHKQTRKLQVGNRTHDKPEEITSGAESGIDEPVAANQTNKLFNLAIDISQLKSLYIVSDQNCTIKTNSSGSPDNTINLLADKPYQWTVGDYAALLLTADVTVIYVTNTTAIAHLIIETLQDPTP